LKDEVKQDKNIKKYHMPELKELTETEKLFPLNLDQKIRSFEQLGIVNPR
jgi:hypothetical protein